MIELYCLVDCPACAEIEAALKEMVLAYNVIAVADRAELTTVPPETPLPAIKDKGEIISGGEAIRAHLKMLAAFVNEWRKYQSDSCYVDEDSGWAC